MASYKQIGSDISKEIRVVNNGQYLEISVDDTPYHILALDYRAGILSFILDGQRYQIPVTEANGQYHLAINGREYRLEKADTRRPARSESSQASTVEASMPGTIRAVYVVGGEAVEKGTPVILMEAMKMEVRLVAPCDGVVKAVHTAVGQLVQQNDVLVELTPDNLVL